MLLEILTPEKRIYSGDVYGVQLPGTEGLFEVLDKHAPMISALAKGNVKVLISRNAKAGTKTFSIHGGFVEVMENKATVLLETAIEMD